MGAFERKKKKKVETRAPMSGQNRSQASPESRDERRLVTNAASSRIDRTMSMATTNCSFVVQMKDSPLIRKHWTPRPPFFPPLRCTPLQQQLQQQSEASAILCEPCSGSGWLLCDFCNGQKTNVRAANNRIYRRCPSCRAVGSILCPNCKVFKCVSFPNYSDGEDLTF